MARTAVLAFSGGLDTSYCAAWLRQQGYDVHTVTVQTDNAREAIAAIEERARSLGVSKHVTLDARRELFDEYLKYLIFANALRGGVYPLCVSAERMVQAKRCALYAAQIGAQTLVHGSTGAGNDQIRFDVAFRVFAPDVEILTPVRSQGLSREQESEFLARHGVVIEPQTTNYSINRGLWGVTIGGAETHRSDGVLPEEAYVMTRSPSRAPRDARELTIGFEHGVPVALDHETLDPIRVIGRLDEDAGQYGVGRGVHVGDTILGIKGRVAFEAPAATVLIAAHRELEKLVLSRQQLTWKRTLGDVYAATLHEARFLDPLMRDIEAFLESSQQRVCGEVRMRLTAGQVTVLGGASPYSLLDPEVGLYGEASTLWTGEEAAAFAKIYGLQDWLLARAQVRGSRSNAGVD